MGVLGLWFDVVSDLLRRASSPHFHLRRRLLTNQPYCSVWPRHAGGDDQLVLAHDKSTDADSDVYEEDEELLDEMVSSNGISRVSQSMRSCLQ